MLKYHIIISIDAEKNTDKIYKKTLNKVDIEGTSDTVVKS